MRHSSFRFSWYDCIIAPPGMCSRSFLFAQIGPILQAPPPLDVSQPNLQNAPCSYPPLSSSSTYFCLNCPSGTYKWLGAFISSSRGQLCLSSVWPLEDKGNACVILSLYPIVPNVGLSIWWVLLIINQWRAGGQFIHVLIVQEMETARWTVRVGKESPEQVGSE